MTQYIDTTPDYDWYDSVYEDAKTIAGLMGIDIDRIYFSGFSSQGDGACFTANLSYRKGALKAVQAYAPQDTELHDIARAWTDAHKRTFYKVSGSVSHRGHYYHEHSTSFSLDAEDSRDFDDDSFIEPCRDLMRWIYSQLESECEYLTAWHCAQQWQESQESMNETRADMRALVRDMRAALRSGISASESICAALRRQLRGLASDWEESRVRRDQLAEQFYYRPDYGTPAQTIEQFAESNL